tara:strand:+ start:99 stop:404 length:306 start_codon:yes stop_codon:yes gene_type:complete
MANENDIDHFINTDGLDTEREQTIGQHIGYRYDVNLVPDYNRITPFLQKYMDTMGWQDLNWLEDVHMGYEDGRPAVLIVTSMAGCRFQKILNCLIISRIVT